MPAVISLPGEAFELFFGAVENEYRGLVGDASLAIYADALIYGTILVEMLASQDSSSLAKITRRNRII